MSLATTYFNQIIRGQEAEDLEQRHQSIYTLGCWAMGFEFPIHVMGEEITEEGKGKFVVQLQDLVRSQYNMRVNSIEDLFWLIYAADVLKIRLDICDRDEKLASFFYRQFVKGNYHGIEEIIGAIRLI